MDGPQGLALYLEWKRNRPPGAPHLRCHLTGFGMTTLRTDADWEMRCRLVYFSDLERLYPDAKLPRTSEACVDFEQRCFWMGISLKQGCWLRSYNISRGLQWP